MSDSNAALAEYRRHFDEFRWEVPARFNFGRDVVDRHAEEPDLPALLFRPEHGADRRMSFGDVRDGTNRVANALRALGIGPGDPVIVMLPKLPEWHLVMVGGLKAGALVIPSSTILRSKDLLFRAEHSGAVAIVASPTEIPTVESARGELRGIKHFLSVDPDGGAPPTGWVDFLAAAEAADASAAGQPETKAEDPALVYYTSGTTGPPKAVLHAHAYTFAQRYTAEIWLGVKRGERMWTTSDTGWAKAAYSVLFGPWSVGAEVFMYGGRFDARKELELLQEIAPAVFCAPPTEFRMLVKEDLSAFRFRGLRQCVSAGEPLNPEVIRAWKDATDLTIRDGYGQTETILLVGNHPGIAVRPGSMGLPTPGHRVEVIDDAGEVLPVGEIGDVAVEGQPPSLFLEYWKDEAASNKCRRGSWYVTGDRASRDEDGYFWFVGRADDVIISAGYRIGPFEVESALLEHPDVVEAAVVAAPDPDRGAIVKAFVVLRPGMTGDAALTKKLQDHCKTVTAPYKYPRAIEYRTELPKTVSGKIRRVELRGEAGSS
jgi:acetyl-CoA synthetase/medium-chain acyl-CoA synthetase